MAEHRELVHKIGVTSGSVESRLSGAERDATCQLARVEVVASYEQHNLNPGKAGETVSTASIASAQLDLPINHQFGHPVRPREWFLEPLPVIDEAVRAQRGRINLRSRLLPGHCPTGAPDLTVPFILPTP